MPFAEYCVRFVILKSRLNKALVYIVPFQQTHSHIKESHLSYTISVTMLNAFLPALLWALHSRSPYSLPSGRFSSLSHPLFSQWVRSFHLCLPLYKPFVSNSPLRQFVWFPPEATGLHFTCCDSAGFVPMPVSGMASVWIHYLNCKSDFASPVLELCLAFETSDNCLQSLPPDYCISALWLSLF